MNRVIFQTYEIMALILKCFLAFSLS